MSKSTKPIFFICILLISAGFFISTNVSAAYDLDVYFVAADTNNLTEIHVQNKSGNNYLFLPSSADLNEFALFFDSEYGTLSCGEYSLAIERGIPFSLEELCHDDQNQIHVSFSNDEASISFTIVCSSNIRSMYLSSSDPDKDRAWVEMDKSNKAKNNGMVLLRSDGTVVYDGNLKTIKGRGNSTWNYPKKPYQIKLSSKTDLLETGDPLEIEDTWILLANYIDGTLIHNTIVLNLARSLNLAYTPHCEPIDLYYDGEYLGSYLLCEKTEISDGRVNIRDLESEIEDNNPDVDDFDDLETIIVQNSNDNYYQYVDGLKLPEDYSGGYLLEIDYYNRAIQEKSWFQTRRGITIVIKSPEYISEDGVLYISELYQSFEDAVFNGGIDPETGKDYTEYVDLESLARNYIILEFSADNDSYQSSTFFYKKADDNKLFAGPVWDFDTCFGSADIIIPPDAIFAGKTYIGEALMNIPSFRDKVREIYFEEFHNLIKNTLLGNETAQYDSLLSIQGYTNQIASSRHMNNILWPIKKDMSSDELYKYIKHRDEWFINQILNWESTAQPYFDVTEDDWFYEDVKEVKDLGLFSSGAMFYPDNQMTRAMCVTVLYRIENCPQVDSASFYDDVELVSWYHDAVLWATKAGIVQGFEDNSFRPDLIVSREQLATFLYRYAQYKNMSTDIITSLDTFDDYDSVSDYAYIPLSWAVSNELFRGTDRNLLLPLDGCTRSQAAAIFQRLLHQIKQVNIEDNLPNEGTL